MAIPLDRLRTDDDLNISLKPHVLNSIFQLQSHQITLIHGPNKAPLTLLAHNLAVQVAKAGKSVVFLDSGKNYNPRIIRSMCKNSSQSEKVMRLVHFTNILNLEDIQLLKESLREFELLFLLIIDNLTNLLNLSGNPGSKERQRKLFNTLECLRGLANSMDIHILLTGHSKRNWDSGKIIPIGGNVLTHDIDWSLLVGLLEGTRDYYRILAEKSPIHGIPPAIVVRIRKSGVEVV